MGEHGFNWKGGRTLASHGYVLVWVGKDHHLADVRGYAYEHRLRRLRPGEQVHHLNGDKADNDPENIEVLPSRLRARRAPSQPPLGTPSARRGEPDRALCLWMWGAVSEV